ncbi:MAG: DUF2974 domain-containing protein [Bacilli bacterium]|nr:DUF2974 domain-containing protein [Bacilli bacterium]
MDLLRYIASKKETWEEDPLNKIDVLGYVWLSYFDFRPVQERFPLAWDAFKNDPFFDNLEKRHETFVPKSCATLFRNMIASPRYQKTVMVDYQHIIDSDQDVQFGALALSAGGKTIVIFEGTDLSFVGWKEDCIMSYSDSVPSYPLAEAFIKRTLEKTEGPVILAGHSKGGNIAAYCLATLEDDSRIESVYSFEGPGFHSDNVFSAHPERMEKLHKYIPYSSVVGVLLCNETNVSIVKSGSVGVLQHNTFKWRIQGNDFEYANKRSLSSLYIDKAVNGWLKCLDEDERKRFIEITFNTLNKTKVKDFKGLAKTLFKEIPTMRQAYKEMGDNDKTFFASAIKSLFSSAGKAFVDVAKEAPKSRTKLRAKNDKKALPSKPPKVGA